MENTKPYPKNSNYLISCAGKVFHKERKTPLQPQTVTNGYLYVALKNKGTRLYKGIHRLVAETWIPNPMNLAEVNHRDCDKTNNCVSNLEWCTRKENVRHSSINKKGRQKLNPADIVEIKKHRALGKTYKEIAEMYSVTDRNISAIVNGRIWV